MEFLLGNENEFFEFLNSINKNDHVAILTHTDLDGIASGIFLERILESKRIKIEFIKFIQYSSGLLKQIFKELQSKEITKLFILDFNADTEENGLEDFELIRSEINTFLIDHHPSSPNLKDKTNIIKTKSTDCASLILYNLGKNYLQDKRYLELVCAAMITDFSFKNPHNLEFIKKYYPDFQENSLDSSIAKIADTLSLALIYFKSKLINPYKLIQKDKVHELEKYSKEIKDEINRVINEFETKKEYYRKNDLYFYYFESKFGISSYVSTELSIKNPDKTFIIVTNRDKELLSLSARNQSGKEDMAALLRKAIENLSNSTAGGHFRASGGSILKKDLNKFKENLLR